MICVRNVLRLERQMTLISQFMLNGSPLDWINQHSAFGLIPREAGLSPRSVNAKQATCREAQMTTARQSDKSERRGSRWLTFGRWPGCKFACYREVRENLVKFMKDVFPDWPVNALDRKIRQHMSLGACSTANQVAVLININELANHVALHEY